MADSNDNNNPSHQDGEWPHPPYAWILTPILLFALIALAATIIGVRRRRSGRRLASLPHSTQRHPHQTTNGRAAATDLEAGSNAAGRGGRRWGGLRRREERVEGLNEEGEAPPPYEPGKKADVGVELEEVERVRERLPGYGEEEAGEGAVRTPPAAVTRE